MPLGCYTSSSRKEVLPLFEKHDALLWYPSHYEGFETSDNVVYTGAAPNQHIVPLANYLLAKCGHRGWFVGSNYIWAWENNRIMRDMLQARGGTVLGERYVAVGDTDLAGLVALVLASRPDFVFNTLIGESSYRFHRLLHAALDSAPDEERQELPVASCSLAEPELRRMGEAAAGHLSSSVYFSTLESEENRRFSAAWRARHPDLGHTCADAEAAYIAVHLLARAIRRAGGPDFQSVREAAMGLELRAPQGPVRVDPETRHCYLRPRIGRSRSDGTFDVVYECPTIVRPDPYLVWEALGTAGGTALRVVP